jgi:hypothetical protein
VLEWSQAAVPRSSQNLAQRLSGPHANGECTLDGRGSGGPSPSMRYHYHPYRTQNGGRPSSGAVQSVTKRMYRSRAVQPLARQVTGHLAHARPSPSSVILTAFGAPVAHLAQITGVGLVAWIVNALLDANQRVEINPMGLYGTIRRGLTLRPCFPK